MDIPGAPRRGVRRTVSLAGARRTIIALLLLLWLFGPRVCSEVGNLLDRLPREATAQHSVF